MDLGRPGRIDAAKIQGFLEQTKSAAKVRQRMDSARCTQPVKDTRVPFALSLPQKSFHGTSHLFAAHPCVLGIRPQPMPGTLLVHFREALPDRRLNVSHRCDLTPAQL